LFARPAHTLEYLAHARPPLHADEPVAAILGRADHRVAPAQCVESRRDLFLADRRNIRTDDDDGPRRQVAEEASHAMSEIALALPHARQVIGPDAPLMHGAVRRDGDHRLPARVAADAADEAFARRAEETQRLRMSDVPRKSRLHAAD